MAQLLTLDGSLVCYNGSLLCGVTKESNDTPDETPVAGSANVALSGTVSSIRRRIDPFPYTYSLRVGPNCADEAPTYYYTPRNPASASSVLFWLRNGGTGYYVDVKDASTFTAYSGELDIEYGNSACTNSIYRQRVRSEIWRSTERQTHSSSFASYVGWRVVGLDYRYIPGATGGALLSNYAEAFIGVCAASDLPAYASLTYGNILNAAGVYRTVRSDGASTVTRHFAGDFGLWTTASAVFCNFYDPRVLPPWGVYSSSASQVIYRGYNRARFDLRRIFFKQD